MATALKPRPKVAQLSEYMGALKGQMSLALPKHLSADRMTRLVLTEFSKNPTLQECTFESIAGCVMTAAQLGLEIGVGGQAYIIPYSGKATFVPGWKGLIDLVNRAGRATCWTGAVFEGDVFEWAIGDSPFVRHKPMGEDDPKKLLFAYAIGRVTGAEWPIIECWPNARLQKHFDRYNKVGKRHYAHTNWEMYCRKIVLLQVLKYLPQSVELQNAIEVAHAAEAGQSCSIIDGEFVTVSDEQLTEPKAAPKTLADLEAKVGTFDLAAYKAQLRECNSPDDITALVKKIDFDTLGEGQRELIDKLAFERETAILGNK